MKTEWKKVRLDEMGTISRGRSKHRPRNDPSLFDGKYPFIQTADVKNANLYISEYSQTYNEKGLSQSKLWQPGTLCITIAANIADTGILSIPACFPDSVMGFIPFKEVSDARYVKYCFDILQRECKAISVGAAQDNLSWDKLSRIQFPCPPLETQQKIAGILSAYDDLIENNRKQIKLLEEAAQKLYKEWFVKLNFPGHENVKIVDGVPEGWKILTVEDLIGKLESGSRPKGGIDSTIKKGIASVGAENVIGLGQYNYSSEKFVNKEFYENAKRGKIEDKDILIYKDGAYIGRTSLFQDNFPHKEAMINEHVFLLHAREESNQYFLFFTLYQRTYFEKMQKLNKNAAQPGINQDAIKSLKFLMPTEQLIREFDNFVTPIVKRIFAMAKQNSQLQSARDKLLPRLMNGEI